MYKLTYSNCDFVKHWKGSYDVMLNKQDVLCNVFDYDCQCFTLVRLDE